MNKTGEPSHVRHRDRTLLHVKDCDCDPVRGTPGRKCKRYTDDVWRTYLKHNKTTQ